MAGHGLVPQGNPVGTAGPPGAAYHQRYQHWRRRPPAAELPGPLRPLPAPGVRALSGRLPAGGAVHRCRHRRHGAGPARVATGRVLRPGAALETDTGHHQGDQAVSDRCGPYPCQLCRTPGCQAGRRGLRDLHQAPAGGRGRRGALQIEKHGQ